MFTKILYNKDNDNKVVDIVDDFVVYYDDDNDIVIINDIVEVYNKDDDDIVNDIVVDFKVNDNDNVDNDNVLKYVRIKSIINNVDDIVVEVNNDDNKFVFIDNTDINDFVNNSDDKYVVLSMNKDIYNEVYYDLNDYIVFAFVVYNYDNDNVIVVVKDNNVNFVLDNINYSYLPLKLHKTIKFLNNQIQKNLYDFNIAKQRYFEVNNPKAKQRLINFGNAKLKNIDKSKAKLQSIDNNIKDIAMLKQYIIKNNCYYNDLNKLTNEVYKVFKGKVTDKDLKDKITKINKDNVNKNYKYDIEKVDNDNDFVFDIVNNNFVVEVNYDDDLFVDKDFVEVVDKYEKDLNDLIVDLSYNLNDDFKFNILNAINFDLQSYEKDLNVNKKELNLSIKELKDIEKDIILDDLNVVEKAIVKDFVNYKNKVYDLINIVDFLNVVKDFVEDLKDNKDNKDDYDIYDFDIFQSKLNKHNSKIKAQQSDFLKIAFNEKLNDFIVTD